MKTKKKKHLEKTPSTIQRKFPVLFGCFANFFTPCLHLISLKKKIPLYNTEKNSSFVDVFLEKIFDLVLKFTRLSIAMLFVKYNYDIIILLRALLTRARSGEVQYENNIH